MSKLTKAQQKVFDKIKMGAKLLRAHGVGGYSWALEEGETVTPLIYSVGAALESHPDLEVSGEGIGPGFHKKVYAPCIPEPTVAYVGGGAYENGLLDKVAVDWSRRKIRGTVRRAGGGELVVLWFSFDELRPGGLLSFAKLVYRP
jgi:hypothetical protein